MNPDLAWILCVQFAKACESGDLLKGVDADAIGLSIPVTKMECL